MPNHVHLIAVPSRPEAPAEAIGATHLRYTRQINRREKWTGYLWQGRFASFPMDEDYLLTCARYVGLNPCGPVCPHALSIGRGPAYAPTSKDAPMLC